jgi:hypothetical protein
MGLSVNFGLLPVSGFLAIYNSDSPLRARLDMDVLDHNRLAVSPAVSVHGFNQFVLELNNLLA